MSLTLFIHSPAGPHIGTQRGLPEVLWQLESGQEDILGTYREKGVRECTVRIEKCTQLAILTTKLRLRHCTRLCMSSRRGQLAKSKKKELQLYLFSCPISVLAFAVKETEKEGVGRCLIARTHTQKRKRHFILSLVAPRSECTSLQFSLSFSLTPHAHLFQFPSCQPAIGHQEGGPTFSLSRGQHDVLPARLSAVFSATY
jgi:hypothetical protein